jgi:hypothetical protein
VLASIHDRGTTLIVVEEAPERALTLCNRRVEVRNGAASGVAGAAWSSGTSSSPASSPGRSTPC